MVILIKPQKKLQKVIEAIKYECEGASDVKSCGLEVRRNFVNDGNEYENLSDLDKVKLIKYKPNV